MYLQGLAHIGENLACDQTRIQSIGNDPPWILPYLEVYLTLGFIDFDTCHISQLVYATCCMVKCCLA